MTTATARKPRKRRAKGWERKKANRDTRREILDAAAVAFASKGYEAASLADIARQVGIQVPSLYNHFRSKNQILFTFLSEHGEAVIRRVEQALAEAGPTAMERMEAYIRARVLSEIDLQDVMPIINAASARRAVLAKTLTPSQRDKVTAVLRHVGGLLRGILDEGRRRKEMDFEDLTTASFAILGMLDTIVLWYRKDGSLTPETIADHFCLIARRIVARH